MRICILSGSARQNNNTIRLSLAIKRIMSRSHQVAVIDFKNYDVPFQGNGGIIQGNETPFQAELLKAMDEAHVVILVSPEYNWSTTPEILNLLQILPDKPFSYVFANKVFAVAGVSTGKGGKAPALHIMQILNKILSFGNQESVLSSRIFEAHFVKEVLDENGESKGNELFDKGLEDFCQYTDRIASRWFR